MLPVHTCVHVYFYPAIGLPTGGDRINRCTNYRTSHCPSVALWAFFCSLILHIPTPLPASCSSSDMQGIGSSSRCSSGPAISGNIFSLIWPKKCSKIGVIGSSLLRTDACFACAGGGSTIFPWAWYSHSYQTIGLAYPSDVFILHRDRVNFPEKFEIF